MNQLYQVFGFPLEAGPIGVVHAESLHAAFQHAKTRHGRNIAIEPLLNYAAKAEYINRLKQLDRKLKLEQETLVVPDHFTQTGEDKWLTN